jgi:hypothetical protein
MKKATQTEFDTLKNNYNELRSFCSSLEREIRELENVVRVLKDKKISKATKGDIMGLADYVEETIDSYESSGRPYDDDELLDNRQWAQRCVDWLKQQAKEMS